MKPLFRRHYPLLVIVVLGLALRLQLMFHRGQYWFDEVFSIHFSSLPWEQAIKFWALETNPPLYMLLLRGLFSFLDPHQEQLVRLVSVFFGIASIALLYLMAERVFNRATAVFASLFLTLSNIHIVQSTEVRGYSLLALLTIISVWLFHIIVFERKRTWPIRAGFVVANTLLLYTHLTALPIIFIEAVFMYFLAQDKKERWQWIKLHGIPAMLWLPWTVIFAVSKFSVSTAGAWYFNGTDGPQNNIIMLFLSAFTSLSDNIVLVMLSLIIPIFICYFFLKLYKEKERRYWLLFLASIALLPMIISAMLGVYVPKYLITSYPILHIIIAYSLTSLFKNHRQKKWALFAAFLLLLPAAVSVTAIPVYSTKKIISYLETHQTPNSIILVAFPNELSFKWYYHGALPVILIYLNEDGLTEDERVVRNNWHPQITSEKEVSEWVKKQIEAYKPDKIFLIEPHNLSGYDWVEQSFETLGWRRGKIKIQEGYFGEILLEYAKPQSACLPAQKL